MKQLDLSEYVLDKMLLVKVKDHFNLYRAIQKLRTPPVILGVLAPFWNPLKSVEDPESHFP